MDKFKKRREKNLHAAFFAYKMSSLAFITDINFSWTSSIGSYVFMFLHLLTTFYFFTFSELS